MEIKKFPGKVQRTGPRKSIELTDEQLKWLKVTYKLGNITLLCHYSGIPRNTIAKLLDRYKIPRRKLAYTRQNPRHEYNTRNRIRQRNEMKALLSKPILEEQHVEKRQEPCIGKQCYCYNQCLRMIKRNNIRTKNKALCDSVIL